MADKNLLQGPGDFDLSTVMLIGSSGETQDVTSLVAEFNIYENIDLPYLTGNLVITDASSIAEKLPIIGQERLLFTLKTPELGATIDFTKYHAVVYNMEKRFNSTDRSQVYLLNWTTLDNYRNIRIKVSKSFDGTISSMVDSILSNDKFLGTKKPIFLEETSNVRKFVAPNLRPFQTINLLREEAISKEEESPHFVFFENTEGYHFQSIDSLLGSKKELSTLHKRTYKSQPPKDPRDIDDSLSTILNWNLDDGVNTFMNTKSGMFGSTLLIHDIYNKNIEKYEYNYIEDLFNIRNSTNQEGSFGPMISESLTDDKLSIHEFPDSRVYFHPKNKNKNFSEMWLQESISRELEREYFTLTMEVYGDTNITCGDLIDVKIPSNRAVDPAQANEAMDTILSGRYLITQLKHTVKPTAQMHTMTMTVMKDSVMRSLISKTIKYPEPPTGKKDIGLIGLKRRKKRKTRVRTVTAIAGVRG